MIVNKNRLKTFCTLVLALVLSAGSVLAKSDSDNTRNAFLTAHKGIVFQTMPDGTHATFKWQKNSSGEWKVQSVTFDNGKVVLSLASNSCQLGAHYALEAAAALAEGHYFAAGVYTAYSAYYFNKCRKGE